ncbi:MAG: hypothetical protein FWD65_05910, partial [Coriobacteriia bacterium]|nr:hypothetical protein [Coriobacteriia bacterium]
MKRNLRVITNNALFNKKASWLFGVLLLVCLIIPVAAMASSAKASFVANYAPAAGMDSSENGELLACFQSGKPVVINRSTGVVEDVAVSSSGEKGNGNYVATISLSKDGRYVVFASNASNLAPGVDPGQTSTGYCNIFLRDRKTHETVLVSRSYTGFPNGGSGITRNAISDDGKYIVFWSDASNLTPDDTNGVSDVYIYDVGSGLLRLISLDGNGEASAQGSSCAIISGDGKSVAYATGSYGLNTVFSSDWKSQSIPVIAPGTQGTMGGAPVAFSKDGKKLLCDYQSDTLYDMWDHYYIIYDLAQGTRLVRSRTPSGNSMGSGATDISSDGRFIVLADDYQLYQSDKGYRVIDWLNNKEYSFGELDSSYKGSSNYGAPAIFSGDGRLLFFSSQTQVYNSWGIFVTLLSGLNTTSTTISKDEFAVFVREKASGMPISGASVTVGGTVFTTDSTGKASVKGKFGTQVVSVTAPGYQSQARSETIKLGTGVFFLLDPASNMPTVSQALLNGKTDLKCVGNGPVYTVGDTTRARIKVTADWKNYKPGLYIISQAGRVPVNSTTGDFNFLPGQVFDADKSIYLQLQGTDPATGQTVMSQHYDLHLRMQKPAAGLFGSSVRVGSKMQFDIPKDIPVVGGAPMDFDLKFVPFSLDIEGNRIRVGLGCSDVGRMKENWDEFVNISDTLAKNQKDATKSLAALDELKQYGFKASKLDLMDNIKPKADFNVFGYMEGYIDSKGNPVFSQGYAVLGLDLKASYTQQFVVGPVPAYIKVAVGLEIQKQLNCGTMQDNHLLYTGDLTLTPKGSLEGGVGVKGVCSIGAEGEIKLPVTINTAQNYQTIEWKGTAKLIVGAFEPFVYKYKFAEGGGVLYDSRKQGAKVSGSAAPMSGAAAPTGMPTLDEFKLASRSDGEWKAISAAKPSAQSASGMQGAPAPLASAAPGFTTLQTGTMSSSKPQMIAVGNKLLAVWQEDNSARSSINRSMLVYSVKSAGAWSAPQAVWDNGAPDGTAQLFTDGSKVWLVWQKAKSSISVADETDSATVIPAYAAAQEIATAQWDTATSTFSSKSYLTNDSTLDLLPSGVMIQGTPTVSWVSNSANDIFGSSGTNTIKTATLDGSSWDIKTIAT